MTNKVENIQAILKLVETLETGVGSATAAYNEGIDSVDTETLSKEMSDLNTALFHLAHEGSQFGDAVRHVKSYLKHELAKEGVEVSEEVSLGDMLRAMMEEMED
ncbi:hypothetical protein [Rummeliibacillus stabekisii]|uniref:hypothetical protein n=1 Tax=Rummeliibacillus stabekisii TaxID=241244 RepID=UPI003723FCA0